MYTSTGNMIIDFQKSSSPESCSFLINPHSSIDPVLFLISNSLRANINNITAKANVIKWYILFEVYVLCSYDLSLKIKAITNQIW